MKKVYRDQITAKFKTLFNLASEYLPDDEYTFFDKAGEVFPELTWCIMESVADDYGDTDIFNDLPDEIDDELDDYHVSTIIDTMFMAAGASEDWKSLAEKSDKEVEYLAMLWQNSIYLDSTEILMRNIDPDFITLYYLT